MFANDILDKDKFWTDELMNVNKLFLFGLAQMGGLYGERKGIIEKHAYSIMEAKELDQFRLLKVRYVVPLSQTWETSFIVFAPYSTGKYVSLYTSNVDEG